MRAWKCVLCMSKRTCVCVHCVVAGGFDVSPPPSCCHITLNARWRGGGYKCQVQRIKIHMQKALRGKETSFPPSALQPGNQSPKLHTFNAAITLLQARGGGLGRAGGGGLGVQFTEKRRAPLLYVGISIFPPALEPCCSAPAPVKLEYISGWNNAHV